MTKGRVLYFINGLGVGIAMTLLWAPKSGAATRGALRHAASEGQDFVGQQAKDAQKTIQDTLQRGKEAAKTTSEGVAEAFGAGKSVLLR
jgi:gas vesicle protein